MSFANWHPYIISIVIGLIVGIEREKSHPHGNMGVRTFTLIALLGALAGGLRSEVWLTGMLAVFALSLIAGSYWISLRKRVRTDAGLTTEFAGGIIFTLGFLSHLQPLLVSVLGPLVGVLLFSKRKLHKFTSSLKSNELEAALLLLLVGVTVINFLEDRVIDPWGVFNPRQFGLLVLILAVLEFASYVAAKTIGAKRGVFIMGFLGGLVSSTAMLVSAAKAAKAEPDKWRLQLVSALLATLASLILLLIIVGYVSPEAGVRLALPIVSALIVGTFFILISARKVRDESVALELRSPLDWKGIFRLAVLLGAILAGIALARRSLGEAATMVLVFITGLFELHGVALATATLHAREQMDINSVTRTLLLATTASLLAKVAMTWIVGSGAMARAYTKAVLALTIVIWLTALI